MVDISKSILKQFATVVAKDNSEPNKEQIVYATVTENGVRIDGSSVDTPVSSTTDRQIGERVTVMIKNHKAVITGNLTSPSARTDDVKDITNKVVEFEKVVANVLTVDQLNAQIARIDKLEAEDVSIRGSLTANQATIDELVAYDLEVKGKIEANEASISKLDTDKLSAEDIEGKYANIDFSNIGQAAMEYFYSKSGLIDNVEIGDATITGDLVGVTISGDLIKADTIMADKLVIKGEDGLFYKLNYESGGITGEQIPNDSLHGSVITANSIAASKINVDDLQAFNATIGGFKITTDSIYSGVKESINNTTNGLYLNKTGEVCFGNASDYVKFYKDTSGNYKLDISANSITFGSSKKNLDTTVADIYDTIDDVEIGGRNLFLNTKTLSGFQHDTAVTLNANDEGVTVASWSTRSSPTWAILSTVPIKYDLVKNRKITFSMLVKSEDYESLNADTTHGIMLSMRTCTNASMNSVKYKDLNFYKTELSDAWAKLTWTADITDSFFQGGSGDISTATRFYVSMFNYSIYRMDVKKIKLEYGDKATDWTEAPEDVQSKITALDNDILRWCYNNDKTYINGNKIYAHTITAEQLSADAIKSNNYVSGSAGAYLNLSDGSFDSKYFKWTSEGRINATGGSIGGITIDDMGIGSEHTSNNVTKGYKLYNRGIINATHSGGGRDSTLAISAESITINSQGTASGSMPKMVDLNDTSLYWYKYNTLAGYVKSLDDGTLSLYGAAGSGVSIESKLEINGATTINSSLYTTSSITSAAALISNSGAIELFGDTPFIDFHYNSSSSDYTHRIIANTQYNLTVTSNLKTNGNFYLNNGQYLYLADSNGNTRVGMYLSTDDYYYLCSNSHQTILRGSSVKLSSTSGATVTSDANLKYDIEDLDERMDIFFDNLKPRRYKYVFGTSQRTHYGFITQEVEEALYKAGLTTKEFGGVNIIPIKGRETESDESGTKNDMENSAFNYLLDNGITEEHDLVYTEFISLIYSQVQKLKNVVKQQQEEINRLKNTM